MVASGEAGRGGLLDRYIAWPELVNLGAWRNSQYNKLVNSLVYIFICFFNFFLIHCFSICIVSKAILNSLS